MPATTLLAAVPYFWLALILVYVLATSLRLFPSQGGYDVVLDPGCAQRPVELSRVLRRDSGVVATLEGEDRRRKLCGSLNRPG